MTKSKTKQKGRYYDALPDEGKKTVDNFSNYIDLYFKNQQAAADVLLVGQSAISRYVNGESAIPQEVASLLVEHLQGKIALDEIYFSQKQYKAKQKTQTA